MARIEKEDIRKIKLYLGPMSKNIVDAIIKYNHSAENPVGMIASRRQIDNIGGYVNNWKTSTFTNYVKGKSTANVICRDHAGPMQGKQEDDGIDSLLEDSMYWNIIHIDPFKIHNYGEAIDYTIRAIEECYKACPDCHFYEIGTEESISYMDDDILYYFILSLKSRLDPNIFSRIVYAVIQSGTSLKSGKNTGIYDEGRLISMVDVCNDFGLLSKEHNGDYLLPEQIKHKFKLGLSAINIAPEVANIESEYIINNISDAQIEKWFKLCMIGGQWKKWFSEGFNPESNKSEVLRLCGHYAFTNPNFIDIFDLNNASQYVSEQIYKFINKRT
jgi:hypothetical protein